MAWTNRKKAEEAMELSVKNLFEEGTTLYISSCQISDNKFVVCYEDGADGQKGKAIIGRIFHHISSNSYSILWGSIVEFETNRVSTLSVCKLDEDKFVVCYRDRNDGKGKSVVGTVSGTVITLGSSDEFEAVCTGYISCCEIDTDKFVVCFGEGTNGTARVAEVSGTTFIWGAVKVFATIGIFANCSCCKLDTNKFVVCWYDHSDTKIKSIVTDVVYTNIEAFGAEKEVSASASYQLYCCAIDINKFVICYLANSKGEAKMGLVSNKVISLGDEKEFEDGNIDYVFCAKVNSQHFIITYRDNDDSNKGKYNYSLFSGTSISIGTSLIFNDGLTRDNEISIIEANKVVICFRDGLDANKGKAIVGVIPGFTNRAKN